MQDQGGDANPLESCPERKACQRRSFYYDVPQDSIFVLAQQAVQSMRPERITLPGERHIRSVHRVWFFRDDMEILITGSGEGSVLHVRSASRFGSWDFGVNSRRIRRLVEALNDLVASWQARADS
ncbi:MAG: DUF1499 domain-containing protein [Rhodothermia bacterium]|nr:DUF1499 domain-containing protein [Rhodothermia bacterium]